MTTASPKGHHAAPSTDSDDELISIKVVHRKQPYIFKLSYDATVTDLFNEIEATLTIPFENQKLLVPKGQMLKAPFSDPEMPVQNFQEKTLTLIGSGAAEVEAINEMAKKVARRNAARAAQRTSLKTPSRKTQARTAEDVKYTFLQVRPLLGLPHSERSQALLLRLKEDPGIRVVMRRHKFTVSLLTEMEPLSYTQETHEGTSRTLGLNRNQGEVIELRLRTDAYDGYRDYKTIRKTLCHELAHNVHGPHDSLFWTLCHQIEREVNAADWKTGGQTISGDSSRYLISGQDEEAHQDEGGWTGGEFVLGGSGDLNAGLSRREVLAQAAQERQKKEVEAERKACDAVAKGWRPCQRPHQSDESQ